MQNQMLRAALAYAEQGWPVLPLRSRSKQPKVRGGYKAATTDREQIRKWWTDWPDSNIGIRTGPESGIFVLDVDTKDGKVGHDSLCRLMELHGHLPPTRTATSGSGGRHYYFTYQDGLRSTIGHLGKDIDTLGSDRFIVAPPSIHESGNPYRWNDENRPLADPPAWIREGLSTPKSKTLTTTVSPISPAASQWPPMFTDAIANVISAENGHRNDTLNQAAFTAGQCVRAGRVTEDTASATLLRAARGAGLDEREALTTINSGLSAGKATAGRIVPTSSTHQINHQGVALKTLDDLASLTPPSWLIDGYIMDDSIACLYGEPGIGKSLMALHLALSVSAGIPFNGAETRQGGVVYIVAEGKRGTFPRVAAWQEWHSTTPVGNDLRFLIEPVQLLDTGQVHALLVELATLPKPPALIVIDTLALCTIGIDENSQKDMGLAVASILAIQQATGSAVLVVHHTNKTGKDERGSNVLRSTASTMMELRRSKGAIQLICSKQREGAHFSVSDWELRPVGSSCVIVPAESAIDNSKAAKLHALSVNQGTMLATVQANPSGLTFTAAKQASGLAQASAHDALATLLGLGLITETKKGKGRIFRPADPVNGSFGLGAYAPQPIPNTEPPQVNSRTFTEPNYRTSALDRDLPAVQMDRSSGINPNHLYPTEINAGALSFSSTAFGG